MSVDITMFGTAAIILASCAGAALLKWVDMKRTAEDRQFAHAERLKALELGQALPDAEVARLKAESEFLQASLDATGNRTAGAVAASILVPLIMAGSAVGGTALVLLFAEARLHLPLVCTIWGVSGLVSLVTVATAAAVLRRQPVPPPTRVPEKPAPFEPRRFEDSPASFQEKPGRS
jgi:hypothetical protein